MPHAGPSSVASLLGACSLDGPCTPPQPAGIGHGISEDLLWQYRAAQTPAMSAPSPAFNIGAPQVRPMYDDSDLAAEAVQLPGGTECKGH